MGAAPQLLSSSGADSAKSSTAAAKSSDADDETTERLKGMAAMFGVDESDFDEDLHDVPKVELTAFEKVKRAIAGMSLQTIGILYGITFLIFPALGYFLSGSSS